MILKFSQSWLRSFKKRLVYYECERVEEGKRNLDETNRISQSSAGRGMATGSASAWFAEPVEGDEQSGAKRGDEEQIHSVDHGHITGEAGFEEGEGRIFWVVEDGDRFSSGVGVDDTLRVCVCSEMRPVEGTPGAEIFGGSHLVAILNLWAVALHLFKLAGDKTGGGDDALGLGPLEAVFGAEIARKGG
jgi:hypothetical protein